MESEVRTTSVVILGRDYKIRTTESEEFVRDVATFVDAMMSRISSKMSSGTTSQIAVLAALNIAEELFRERRNGHASPAAEENGESVDDRLKALLLRLEDVLAKPLPPTSRKSGARNAVSS